MKRVIQILIFASIFTLIYLGMNYFVLSGIFGLLNIAKSGIFYVSLFLLSGSFIVASVIEHNTPNKITRYFYILSSTLLGAVFISLSVLIVYYIINIFIHIQAFIVIGLILVLTIYSIINAENIVTRKIKVEIQGLKKPMRAVQLTDIHLGTVHSSPFLKKIVEKTNSLKPDVVFITGDLVDGSAPLTSDIVSPINKIKAKTFFTIGNHEIYDGIDEVMNLLKTTKLDILRNKVAKFKELQIIGVDYSDDKEYLGKILPNMEIKKNKPSILLYHPPSDLKFSNMFGIQLQLAGHTHAGQIFPFNLLVRTSFKYVRGFHKEGKSSIYVSQGTGTWGPAMRLGSKSEITVIELVPEKLR